MKKIKIYLIMIVVLVTLMGVITSASNSNKSKESKNLGESHKVLMEEKKSISKDDDSKMIAKVNKVKIYSFELEAAIQSNDLSERELSDDEVLDKLIKYEVLRQKTEELGIVVTEEEIKSEIEDIREAMINDPVIIEIMDPYLEGLGMTIEEYVEYSKESLMVNRAIDIMKDSILKDIPEEDRDIEWDSYVNECISSSKIKKYNQD